MPASGSSASIAPRLRALAGSDPRGTIACGDHLCHAANEECHEDVDEGFACIPSSTPLESLSGNVWACDDASDCGAGEMCCFQQLDILVFGARCAPVGAAATCAGAEICVPGGAPCRTARTSCSARGVCSAGPRVACGSSTCAAGAAPVCCRENDAERCVASEDECRGGAWFECTSASDCGEGQRCCWDWKAGFGRCEGTCARVTLCASDVECAPGQACKPPWDQAPAYECQ